MLSKLWFAPNILFKSGPDETQEFLPKLSNEGIRHVGTRGMAGDSPAGERLSLWMATSYPLWYTALTRDARCDVCLVGAGIAGLSTAYLLCLAGRDVIVLDSGPIGGGMTGRTTAHLSFPLDDRYYELERQIGLEGMKHAAESHRVAVDCIETIVNREHLDCDFVRLDGYLFTPPGEGDQELREEFGAAQRAGVPGVRMVARAPLTAFDTGSALLFPNQG